MSSSLLYHLLPTPPSTTSTILPLQPLQPYKTTYSILYYTIYTPPIHIRIHVHTYTNVVIKSDKILTTKWRTQQPQIPPIQTPPQQSQASANDVAPAPVLAVVSSPTCNPRNGTLQPPTWLLAVQAGMSRLPRAVRFRSGGMGTCVVTSKVELCRWMWCFSGRSRMDIGNEIP